MTGQIEAPTALPEVIRRMQSAINAHDLDALIDCFATDVRSEQPVHPARTFQGNQQIRENWTMIFAGVPDLRAELIRSAENGHTVWTEWHWSGTRRDGTPHDMRGVTVQRLEGDRIAGVTFYMEQTESGGADVATTIRTTLGARP